MLRAPLTIVAALLLVAVPARAQDDALADYDRIFREGIEHLTAGRYDEGIAAFHRCLELAPQNATCAYNIACGHSLKKEAEPGFEWLGKAADWGFGHRDGNIEHAAEKDPDLALLRGDARFAEIVERMHAMRAAVAEHVSEAAVYLPRELAEGEQWTVLLVLHERASTKDQVIAGPWRKIADRFGVALVAPSGTVPLGGWPADGMAWFGVPAEYADDHWKYERPASDAMAAFRKEHGYERGRVFVAGEDEGAAIAFNLAINAPGLYRSVLMVDGRMFNGLAGDAAPRAAQRGLEARILFDENHGMFEFSERASTQLKVNTLETYLDLWGVPNVVTAYTPDPTDPNQRFELVSNEVAAMLSPVPARVPD